MISSRTLTKTFQTTSETQTEQLGDAIGRRIRDGICICLNGSLGTGKSVLARGLCRGLGVGEQVVSPTFILVEEYPGRLPVIHCDLYRLEHEDEIEALGLFDRLGDGSVIVAEWGERSGRVVDAADVVFHLTITGETTRSIEVQFTDDVSHVLGEV